MFQNCVNLIYPPKVLPGQTLGQSGYRWMFYNCTSLIQTPEICLISESNCANFGCESMFYNCTSLKYGPTYLLPQNNLDITSMYFGMFNGCSSLLYAPKINATNLGTRGFNSMFYNCKLIDKIEVNFTEWSENPINWVKGVSPSGTFICPKELPEIRRCK